MLQVLILLMVHQVTSIGQSKDPARPLLSFDVISETLRATNLGDLEMNSSVNFERCALQRIIAVAGMGCGADVQVSK